MPAKGWKDILWRVWAGFNQDRILLIAAGTTFYLLLALFPALAAFVSLYGFVADPKTIAEQIAFLGGVLPSGGLDIINNQLEALALQDTDALSIGFFLGLVIALWTANSGIKSLFEGMNVAYGEDEKRGIVHLNLVSFAFTLAALLIGIGLIVSVGIVPAALAVLRLGRWTEIIISALRWPCLLVMIGVGMAILYRFGPSRKRAQWRWLSWGASTATVVWLVSSWAFSYYLQNFADYNATYGTLGAMIGFMMWTWISVIILLSARNSTQSSSARPPRTPPPELRNQWANVGRMWRTPLAKPRTVVARGGSGPPINPAVGVAPVYPEPIAWCRPVPARPSA